jgi:hypothetical protein
MPTMLETGTCHSVPRKISQLRSFMTSELDLFVLAHRSSPALSCDDWILSMIDAGRVEITGCSAMPAVLSKPKPGSVAELS